MKRIKCVAVGDGTVGKSWLLLSLTMETNGYFPKVFDILTANHIFEDQIVNLQLYNTSGQEDYIKLRATSYPQTDVFILCFSLVSPTSLENISNIWIPDIKEHCPNAPCILVGLKSDLRDDFAAHAEEFRAKGWEPVASKQSEEMKLKINAQCYIECSSLKRLNIDEVTQSILKAAFHPQAEDENKYNKQVTEAGCCNLC